MCACACVCAKDNTKQLLGTLARLRRTCTIQRARQRKKRTENAKYMVGRGMLPAERKLSPWLYKSARSWCKQCVRSPCDKASTRTGLSYLEGHTAIQWRASSKHQHIHASLINRVLNGLSFPGHTYNCGFPGQSCCSHIWCTVPVTYQEPLSLRSMRVLSSVSGQLLVIVSSASWMNSIDSDWLSTSRIKKPIL